MVGTIVFCYTIYEGLLKPYQWIGFLFGLKSKTAKFASTNNFKVSGFAVVLLLVLYFAPRYYNYSLNKPIEIANEYVGETEISFWFDYPIKGIIVPMLVSDFSKGAYIPLSKTEKGFLLRLNLKPGKYLYRFKVGNSYLLDPKNPLWEVDKKDGTKWSVLVVNQSKK
jgi:hypothetical protein